MYFDMRYVVRLPLYLDTVDISMYYRTYQLSLRSPRTYLISPLLPIALPSDLAAAEQGTRTFMKGEYTRKSHGEEKERKQEEQS